MPRAARSTRPVVRTTLATRLPLPPRNRPTRRQEFSRPPLFDAAWYAETAGCSTVPIEAARHYLRHGARRGLWPHPLFVPHHVAVRAPEAVGDADPLLAYLDQRLFKLSPHPLFDLKGYVRAHPESRRHPSGPLGHYVEHGAAQGLAPNPWYTPTPEEPRGLTDWSAARWHEWAARKQLVPRLRTARLPASHAAAVLDGDRDLDGPPPRVSVVVESVRGVDTLARTLRTVVDQVDVRLEIVVVTDGLVPDLDTRLAPLPDHVSLVVVRHEGSRASTGLNLALEQVTGDLVAFVAAGESWEPGRLRRLAAACRDGGGVAYDSMLVHRPEKPPVYAAATLPSGTPPVAIATVELTRLVLAREVLDALGGFDETLRGGWEADFTFRLLSRHEATHVTSVGVERDVEVVAEARRLDPPEQPVPDHSTVPTWSDVAFNRYAIDWERLEGRPAGPDVISVVIPTHDDWRMTRGSVLTVLASEVPAGMSLECIVLDNGSDAVTAQMLDSLEARHDGVRVVHAPTNFGYAVGNNLAVGEVRGDTVVFLNNDTKVDPGWLRPLVTQLADPDVQAVQSLLLYPSGTIQSAGVVFPDCGGVPYAFLAGFPVEDAAGLERESFSALTGASLAMRFQDVVALRGFDPLFRNGMEDVDLCLRLARLRPGRCVVEPASRVTHLESRTAGRFDKVVMNRRLFLDRWDATAPRDDSAIWVGRGFDVVDHVVRTVVSEDRRLCTPEPVLVRSRALVTQHPPRLRWALKNPATQGPWGDAWGDTHFARCLADRAARARPGRRDGPRLGVLPQHRLPRRRRAHAARPDRVPAVVRPGQPRLGDLAPGDAVLAGGHLLRPRARRERVLVEEDVRALGHAHRRLDAGHRPGAVPPRPRGRRHGAGGAVRRQLPRQAPADGRGRDGRRPAAVGLRHLLGGVPAPGRAAGRVRAEHRPRCDVRLGRDRAQRPLGRHAGGRVPVQPAVRRGGQRRPRDHRRRHRSRTTCSAPRSRSPATPPSSPRW